MCGEVSSSAVKLRCPKKGLKKQCIDEELQCDPSPLVEEDSEFDEENVGRRLRARPTI